MPNNPLCVHLLGEMLEVDLDVAVQPIDHNFVMLSAQEPPMGHRLKLVPEFQVLLVSLLPHLLQKVSVKQQLVEKT